MTMAFPDLAPWIQRLKEECPTFAGVHVYGAAEYAAARARGAKVTRCYLLPLADRATPGGVAGGARQYGTALIEVLIALRNDDDKQGAGAVADVRDARAEVAAALIGWAPESWGVVEFVGGQRLGFEDFTLWWSDRYSLDFLLSQ